MSIVRLEDVKSLPGYAQELEYVEGVGALEIEFFNAKKFGGYFLQQNPEEFAAFLVYAGRQKPTLSRYLEIGSASGAFIRCIHERLGFDDAMMIDDGGWQPEGQEANIAGFAGKVTRMVPLDSHSPEAYAMVEGFGMEDESIDLIFVDGDHSYEGVREDIDLVLGVATDWTLIGFHDRYAKKCPGVGRAIDEAIASGKLIELADFKADCPNPLGITVCKRGPNA